MTWKMRWQRSSLGPKRRGVMETSTLACGWPASQASSQGPGQSLNQHIGHKEGLQARPASRHGPLSLSVSLSPSLPLSLHPSLSLSLSLFFLLCIGSTQEGRHGRRQASNRETATWPPRQAASQALVRTTSRTASRIPLFPSLSYTHTHILSLSLPLFLKA